MKNIPPLSIRQVRAVNAVANHASLARASDQLNTSQSTLSRYIADAERSLGQRLFQRGWLGMEPTSQGEIVIAHCQQIVASIGATQATLRESGARVADLSHHLTWQLLNVVNAVCTSGSVSAAATFLDMSQPDVSRALAKLAAAISREAFKRTRGRMTPTEDALLLAELRTKLLAEIMPLPDQLEALSREVTGRVAVGLLPFSEQDVVAKVFGKMLKPYRHVRLQAVTGSYAALTDGLRQGELDFVLGPVRNPPPFDTLEEVQLLQEHFAIVARADHPLSLSSSVIRDLANKNWVVAPHGTPTRLYFEELLIREGLTPPAHTCEIVTFFLAEQVLLHSDAIGLLTYSDQKRKHLNPGLRTIPIDLPDNVRDIGITIRKNQRLTLAQRTFMEFVSAEVSL